MDDTKVAASASTHASARPGRRSHAGASRPACATALGGLVNGSESCLFITKTPQILEKNDEQMSELKAAQRGVVGQGFRMRVIFFLRMAAGSG
jgi:hypothetical protein